jgi:hypothetical protein
MHTRHAQTTVNHCSGPRCIFFFEFLRAFFYNQLTFLFFEDTILEPPPPHTLPLPCPKRELEGFFSISCPPSVTTLMCPPPQRAHPRYKRESVGHYSFFFQQQTHPRYKHESVGHFALPLPTTHLHHLPTTTYCRPPAPVSETHRPFRHPTACF